MSRPVTLCTAQWADMPMEEMAQKASQWGYDGLELACWGNHFNVQRALTEKEYLPQLQAILDQHNLKCFALATHLVGQAVCDNIDTRHKSILPDHVWGDGDPEGVRQRAAKEVADTARAASKFGVHQINGFTGSSVWHMIYSFPPNDFSVIEKGYEDFAARWNPVLDVFKQEGAKFGLEVPLSVEVSDIEGVLQSPLDRRDGACNLAGDESLPADWALVVEEDAVCGVETVGLAVVYRDPVGVKLRDAVR